MTNFDTLLKSLHDDGQGEDTDMIVGSATANLKVDAKRQFSVVGDFDTIIGYEGDINSQIIVIELPEVHAGHQLSSCANKELKWKNLSNGAEGVSSLTKKTGSSTLYEWEVPSDLMAAAGNIEIYISFYDKSDNRVAFAWNTASYSGLSIGKTMSSVGSYYPARDEILVIDEETHNILAPVGYNNTICNYGDKGTVQVYFVVNRYLGRGQTIDVYNDDTSAFVIIAMNELSGLDQTIEKELYSAEIEGRTNEGLVLLKWAVPAGITAGSGGPNVMQIAVGFNNGTQRWVSNTYKSLEVGHSLFEYQADGEPEEWGLTTDFVEKVLEDYFNKGTVVFE